MKHLTLQFFLMHLSSKFLYLNPSNRLYQILRFLNSERTLKLKFGSQQLVRYRLRGHLLNFFLQPQSSAKSHIVQRPISVSSGQQDKEYDGSFLFKEQIPVPRNISLVRAIVSSNLIILSQCDVYHKVRYCKSDIINI